MLLRKRRQPQSTPIYSSAASDVYKEQRKFMAISRRINVDSNRTILTVRISEEVCDPVDDRFEFNFK